MYARKSFLLFLLKPQKLSACFPISMKTGCNFIHLSAQSLSFHHVISIILHNDMIEMI
ncbi:hypothetical protein HMPREF0971_03076 [Segatella oris F0302]|uniref:Uncharacterized protein n=1 Tax=Segatella oris F0302 TaxID=649760 RepID=D1QVN6_9BACT|nr:hypothetical protein HMPREF0971_03076 [Segatella oris F0302]